MVKCRKAVWRRCVHLIKSNNASEEVPEKIPSVYVNIYTSSVYAGESENGFVVFLGDYASQEEEEGKADYRREI